MRTYSSTILILLLRFLPTGAFVVTPTQQQGRGTQYKNNNAMIVRYASTPQEEAQALLDRARKMREQVAEMTGQSVDEQEAEIQKKKEFAQQRAAESASRREQEKKDYNKRMIGNGSFLEVPETFEDQVWQAKAAIERAFLDGKVNRQIVRFALLPDNGETLNEKERSWPGGAQQMYREAAGPLTREVLKQLRVQSKEDVGDNFVKPPKVQSQDIWDFDGSALITAEAEESAEHDVQALVLPNTDSKYTGDISTIDEAMKDRLFLLVNPFWRDLDSWGFNILDPKAKDKAQAAIFDKGFEETYCVLQKTVRGEDCIALKAYPYDWQLYAYLENDYGTESAIRLGATSDEPKASDFAKFLEERDEFKMNKNMRQMQRMLGNSDDQ